MATRDGATSEEDTSDVTSAVKHCKRLGHPDAKCAATLKNLFPATSSSRKKRKFNPMHDCVVLDAQKKKKAANIRIRPKTISVVILPSMPQHVPKGYARTKLVRMGHVKQLVFRRNMSSDEVRSTITNKFSTIEGVESAQFLRCEPSNVLCLPKEQELDGEGVIELAGQGSLYMTLKPVKRTEALLAEATNLISILKAPVKKGGSSQQGHKKGKCKANSITREEKRKPDDEYSLSDSDDEFIPSVKLAQQKSKEVCRAQSDSGGTGSGTSRGLCAPDDTASDIVLSQKLCQIKEKCCRLFSEDVSSGAVVAVKLRNGKQIKRRFPPEAVIKTLYQFVLTQNVEPPFLLSNAFPRKSLELNATGDDRITSHDLGNAVLMIERDVSGNSALSFLELLEPSFSLHYVEQRPVSTLPPASLPIASDYDVVEFQDYTDLEYTSTAKSDDDRVTFMKSLGAVCGKEHTIRRTNAVNDVIELYRPEHIMLECPIHIQFDGEIAVDQGGVSREMFSLFWDEVITSHFEGSHTVTPLVHAHTDMNSLPLMGKILSHGYLVSGFLPVRIALPCLVLMLLGSTDETIEEKVLVEAFMKYISNTDRAILLRAKLASKYSVAVQTDILDVLSQFGCRQLPCPSNLASLLHKAAVYEFCIKPAAALASIYSGVPMVHRSFWKAKGIEGIVSLYSSLSVTAAAVLKTLEAPCDMTGVKERIYSYLRMMIGNLQSRELQCFLRFVSGSSSLTTNRIHVTFNHLSGAARRPIAHTCSCSLELSLQYTNFSEFHNDFVPILSGADFVWEMNSL